MEGIEHKNNNMKVSFAITVCNELVEIKRLVPFLFEHKRKEDEIVILYDEKNGNPEILDFLLPYNKFPHVQTWRGFGFEGNFADWKNKLNDYCKGDYIYQIDADEMISEYMIQNLSAILELNPNVDLIFVPRINTVDGITQEDINKWGWQVNDKGWINWPDAQGRIFRKGMNFYGKVHEQIIGGQKFSSLPLDEEYCIIHEKSIERQRRQNNLYNSL
jgi:glycosyltransferase involved in cell wall biosynthesis